jgi:cell division protein FtsL
MSRQGIEMTACIVLAAAVVATGTWIVSVKMRSRVLFAELEELNREQDRLEIDWGRLRIEQGAYATHPRIEQIARDRLALGAPLPHQVVVVAEP